MNIKQLKKRILLGLIEPELFKMPVGKKENDIPLIFDIYVQEDGKFVTCFNAPMYSNQLYGYSSANVYYQPKNSEGVYINPNTHPDLFHTTPFIEVDPSSPTSQLKSKFSTLLTSFSKPYLEIDWGDGEITQTTIRDNMKVTIDGEIYTYSYLAFTNEENTKIYSNHWYHKYKKSGRYTIKIKGNVPYFYFEFQPQQYNHSISRIGEIGVCNLLKIRQWGDLHVKGLYCFFSFLLNGSERNLVNKATFEGCPEINWNNFKNIVDISYMFFRWATDSSYQDELSYIPRNQLSWDFLGGDNFFDKFPNVISALNCFYENGFEYIPRYCFKNNPYLVNINYAFARYYWDKPFKYIGESACKNLHYLQQANHCFYSYDNSNSYCLSGTEIIEDSIFENCYRLNNGHPFGQQSTKALQIIGDRVFANCYSLADINYSFARSHLLSSVGKELFENCYNLRNIESLFLECGNLQSIGNDMFKGCKNIGIARHLFENTPRLNNIPDNLFVDALGDIDVSNFMHIRYNISCKEDWTFNIVEEYGTDEYLFRKMGLLGVNDSYQYLSVYKEYYPDQTQNYLDYYTNATIDDIMKHLGKNMFNPQATIYGIQFDRYVYYSSTGLYHCRFLYKGEAPPVWTMNCTPAYSYNNFGEMAGTYVYESGSTFIFEQYYDNYDDIPKEQPWLNPRP